MVNSCQYFCNTHFLRKIAEKGQKYQTKSFSLKPQLQSKYILPDSMNRNSIGTNRN